MPTLHKPVFATPAAGLKIRKEDGGFLPEGGDTVIHSTYWARRERDGDVTLSDDLPVDAPAPKAKAAKAETTALAGAASAAGETK